VISASLVVASARCCNRESLLRASGLYLSGRRPLARTEQFRDVGIGVAAITRSETQFQRRRRLRNGDRNFVVCARAHERQGIRATQSASEIAHWSRPLTRAPSPRLFALSLPLSLSLVVTEPFCLAGAIPYRWHHPNRRARPLIF